MFQTLLPLVSQEHPLKVSLVSGTPPKIWLSEADIEAINESQNYCTDVRRKGKLLCMILESTKDPKRQRQPKKYLYLHMGMTGSIRSPLKAVFWGHEGPMKSNPAVDNGQKPNEEEPFPPKYAYLTLQAGDYRVGTSILPVREVFYEVEHTWLLTLNFFSNEIDLNAYSLSFLRSS